MKIVVILLPSQHLTEEKLYCPIGPLYVAAILERLGHQVMISDIRGLGRDEWLQNIPSAELYCMGAMSMQYPNAIRLAKMLKQLDGGRVVLGGVHATVTPDIDPVFDIVVRGEGETGILKVLGKESRLSITDLPLPARHLLPFKAVATNLLGNGSPATTLLASRGCPYKCAFCASPKIYNGVRLRPPVAVAEEIKHLKSLGIHSYVFLDDLLTLNLTWLREFRDVVAPLSIKFRANARVDRFDDERAKLLAGAGCVQVGLGVESVHQPTLDLINKGQTVEQARTAIKLCKEIGIEARVFLIVGLPGDFGDLSGRTIRFLKETKPEWICINSFIPFPGSDIYENPERYGLKFRNNYSLENLKMRLGYTQNELGEDFTIEYDEMSNQQLKKERAKLIKSIQKVDNENPLH